MSLFEKLGSLLVEAGVALKPDVPKVPLEEINSETVMRAITARVEHPILINQLAGQESDTHLFTAETVLAAMGYSGGFLGDRYKENQPEVYKQVDHTLAKLSEGDGPLVEVQIPGDSDGAPAYWFQLKQPQNSP